MTKCEVCGCPVAVQSGEEGTNSYRCLCDAEKAMMAKALVKSQQEAQRIIVSMDAPIGARITAQVIKDVATEALANTSPAALLAQGEALKALITDAETFLDVADDRHERRRARENLMSAVRVARAALAPGEKKE